MKQNVSDKVRRFKHIKFLSSNKSFLEKLQYMWHYIICLVAFQRYNKGMAPTLKQLEDYLWGINTKARDN